MIELSISPLTLVLGVISILGTIFTVFFYFKNPQIKSDQENIKVRDDLTQVQKDIIDIKETHLRNVENDIKVLTSAIAKLDVTVVRLTTIIDERIPKGTPTLTPPGI